MYDGFFTLSVPLTNAQIRLHPLRSADFDLYQRIKHLRISIGRERAEKSNATQADYRAKRKMRMDADFGVQSEEYE